MAVPTKDDLMALAKIRQKPCLSIFMCTDRVGADTQQNPIRLKNLLRRAEEQLVGAGQRSPDACALLEPAYDLLAESLFWRHLSGGLALFVAPEFFQVYQVPLAFDEQIVVNNRFYIKPLLSLLAGDGQFYLLTLSQGGVRLYQGTREGLVPVELRNVPANLIESMHTDESGGSLQFHTAAQATGGPGSERAGMFYGTGMDDNNWKRNIVHYFNDVDRGLRDTVQNEQIPLLLAGVEFLLPLYREANEYQALLPQEIDTGTEPLDVHELHAKAWPLVEPIFTANRAAAIDLYRQLSGEASPKASEDVREVVPAAYYSRVGTLLVAEGAQRWGRFDPDTGSTTEVDGPGDGAEDLLDFASLHTLANGGTVYALRPAEMPSAGPVAALLRY